MLIFGGVHQHLTLEMKEEDHLPSTPAYGGTSIVSHAEVNGYCCLGGPQKTTVKHAATLSLSLSPYTKNNRKYVCTYSYDFMCISYILQVNKNMKLPKQTHSQVIISTAVFELPDTPLTLGFTEKVDEPGTYQKW